MRILVAEDDPVSLGFLELSLAKWGYSVDVVNDGEAALEALKKPDAPKLAILDWVMPKMDGIDVCKELRKIDDCEFGYTYLILLTVKSSLYDMVEGISAGADDYILKPFIPHDLKVRLDAGKRIVELQQKLLESRQALISTTASDLETRTWNREKILSIINAELNRAKRKGRSQSIALLKINNYGEMLNVVGKKGVNEFLCDSMNRIHNTIRSYDSIGRYSDDEFLILFPETISSEMPGIIDRLFREIHKIELAHTGGGLPLSATIGVVTCQGDVDEGKIIHEVGEAVEKAPRKGTSRAYFSVIK